MTRRLLNSDDFDFKNTVAVYLFIYFASAAVAADSNHVIVTPFASLRRFSPPSVWPYWASRCKPMEVDAQRHQHTQANLDGLR